MVLGDVLHAEADGLDGAGFREEPGRVGTVRGEEAVAAVCGGGDPEVARKGGNAAAAVAAHHSPGAIRVKKCHPEGITFRIRQGHEPIRTEAEMPVTKGPYVLSHQPLLSD